MWKPPPEVHNVEGAVEQTLRHRTPSPDAGLYLWDDDGPVSLAGYSGPTLTGIRIGPVYTPLEFRGHGYASNLVADLSQFLLGTGHRRCFLFTDLANRTSNALYRRIGYELIGYAGQYGLQ